MIEMKSMRFTGPNAYKVYKLRQMSRLVRMRFKNGVDAEELERVNRLCELMREKVGAPLTTEN